MIGYYDKQGQPVSSVLDLAKLMEDRDYSRVDIYADDRIVISTVWLGIDHNRNGGKPLIFETMIFFHEDSEASEKWMEQREAGIDVPCPKAKNDLHETCWRWETEAMAKRGHELIVACYKENLDPIKAVEDWRRHAKN